VKKLVILAVGAILFLGAVAIGAVLLATEGSVFGPSASVSSAPGFAASLPGQASPSGPASPSEPAAPAQVGYPPGPRRLQLPAGSLALDLGEPIAHCFQEFPLRSAIPGVLALDLEGQAGGGVAVLDSSVKTWGSATVGLVECARKELRGRVVRVGLFPAGERYVADLTLEPPPSIAPSPPPDPPPVSLPASRQAPPRRSGASR
jgi:hypothetical protein